MINSIKHAPQPTTERISSLVGRIQSGDIKIPKFQRGFVWKENQIVDLLESIYQGYPIGSLLFWLSEQSLKSERDLGGFELPPTPDKYPRNYVLDGQQRLTSIYGVLHWPDPKRLHRLNVYFDLEKNKFFQYNGEENEKQIPMSILFKPREYLDYLTRIKERPNEEKLRNSFEVLYETFREYLIPVVTIKEKTVEDVCPIFERINSTGTQLNVFDLMVAATWSEDFDLNDQIASIRKSAELKDFENISSPTFLKIMSSIGGFGSKRTGIFKLRTLKANDLIPLAEKVQKAIERAVDFLATDLAVPSDAFLPYENQLVVFSYFFSNVNIAQPEQIAALRRWFWQTGFQEHFRGASEGILEQELASINALVNGDFKALDKKITIIENDLLKRQFWKNSAFSKTFVVLLANKNPKNITNGEAIDTTLALSTYNQKEFHHIFPKDFLRNLGITVVKSNNICNICMLSSSQNKYVSKNAPSTYLVESYSRLGSMADNIFISNLIPLGKVVGWKKDDYDLHLEQRASLILNEILSVSQHH